MVFVAVVFSAVELIAGTSLQLGDSTGTNGSTIDVPLVFFTDEGVSAAQIDLYLDPAIADLTDVTGSSAGPGHLVDSQSLGTGRTRVVVYSQSSSNLMPEVLLDLKVLLKSTVAQNGRSVVVESVTLADSRAEFVSAALIPNATFFGPDSSVIYDMGETVSARSVAYGTSESIERVEFLVNGQHVASDTEAPFESDFPLRHFGDVRISVQAIDGEGNIFESSSEDYLVRFPPSLEDWLDVFFTAEEQLDLEIGGLLADVDSDGKVTMMEYAFGFDPLANEDPRGFGFFQDTQTGGYYYSYFRPVGVSEFSYTLELSDQLDVWSAVGGAGSTEVIPINDYLEEVRTTLTGPIEDKQFGRVRLVKVAP